MHRGRRNMRLTLSHVHVETVPTEAGNAEAAGTRMFATLYAQLRQMAQSILKSSGPRLALSPTTLLHEAYINISARDSLLFPDRAHFMAYASRAMRGLIIDYVREGKAQKRGSAFEITSLPSELEHVAMDGDHATLTRISDALDELSSLDTALAELVDLKFFCGFSLGEIANMRCVSERTVQRDWEKARLLLYRSMQQETPLEHSAVPSELPG
jgi:RNA polymerase sigma factor (TIGR02999 family)